MDLGVADDRQRASAEQRAQVFRTWSYETEARLSLEAVRETARKLPTSIYRCKGVVHTAEELGPRVILQFVGKRVDVNLSDLADMVTGLVDGGIILSRVLKDKNVLLRQVMLYRAFVRSIFLGTDSV